MQEGGGDTALAAAAMAAAEDEDDRKATKQSAQEMLNDVAEFDETKKLSSASIDDSNVAKRKGGKADSKNAHAQEEKEDDEILEANLVKLWEGKDELGAMKALEDRPLRLPLDLPPCQPPGLLESQATRCPLVIPGAH